jgi:hypothetical protein
VAIIGLGNAAFETAMAAEDYASFVHFFYAHHGRSGWGWPQLSWETRYVGSPRAARLKPLDAYLLKSLDGFVPRSHVDRGQNKSEIATVDTICLSTSGTHTCRACMTLRARSLRWSRMPRRDHAGLGTCPPTLRVVRCCVGATTARRLRSASFSSSLAFPTQAVATSSKPGSWRRTTRPRLSTLPR